MTDSNSTEPPRRAGPAERWLPIAGAFAVLLVLALFAVGRQDLVPPCPFRSLTGLYCAGCGSGRVARALLGLDFAAAWRANPVVLLATPLMAYGLLREGLSAWGVANLPWPKMRPWWTWALLAGIVGFWILRNIPVWPLTLLAPQ